jgi:hypothetical protein
MDKQIKTTFDQICAEEELKDRTRIFLEQKTRGFTRYQAVPYKKLIAAAACLFLLLTGTYWLYFIPTAEISIDINPSIELGVNRFDRVVSVNARNEDGKELADSLSIKYMDYEGAVRQIMEDKGIAAMLSGDEVMAVTVIGEEGGQCKRMLSRLESCTSERSNAHCYFAESEEAEKAREMGLTCGKYRAFLELQALDQDVKPEEIQRLTMREIREWIQRLLPEGERTDMEENSGYGHHGTGNGGHGRRNGRNGHGSGQR